MDEHLIEYLDKLGIKYKIHIHEAVFTVAESKKSERNIPGMHCKTLFLKDDKDKFYLVGMPAEKRLDSKKFVLQAKCKKIKFASEQELKEEVNLTPGSVSIFGAIYIRQNRTALILDKEVWESEIVAFHPNQNTSTLEVDHKNLEKFYNSLKCDSGIFDL